jgi:hypothetical protein
MEGGNGYVERMQCNRMLKYNIKSVTANTNWLQIKRYFGDTIMH